MFAPIKLIPLSEETCVGIFRLDIKRLKTARNSSVDKSLTTKCMAFITMRTKTHTYLESISISMFLFFDIERAAKIDVSERSRVTHPSLDHPFCIAIKSKTAYACSDDFMHLILTRIQNLRLIVYKVV